MYILLWILQFVQIGTIGYLLYIVYNLKLEKQREKYKELEMKVDSEISYEDSMNRISKEGDSNVE